MIRYFSPTNTTKKVVNVISNGINLEKRQTIDITKSENRNGYIPTIDGDMVVIGVPVYGQRVTRRVASEFLSKLYGANKPVVIVGLYGNIHAGIIL